MKDLVEIKTDFNGMELPVLLEKGLHQTEGTLIETNFNGIPILIEKSSSFDDTLETLKNTYIDM